MFRRFRRSRRRATQMKLSPAGWLFLLIALMVGVGAARFQSALMFLLFGALMGAVLTSVILAHRMLAAVEVQRQAPRRIWQHQTVHLAYFVRNRRRHSSVLGLRVAEDDPEGVESISGYCVNLPPLASFRAGGRFVARKRGRIELARIRLETQFPFGLVTAARRLDAPHTLHVWPARGRLRADLLTRGSMVGVSNAPATVQGGQDEFFGLRDYREGDNPRWIHWRRSASRREPVVREMTHPVPDVLCVVLVLPRGTKARREKMLRIGATLIDHAFGRGYQVGLILAGATTHRTFRPATGRGRRRDLLDALAEVDLAGASPDTAPPSPEGLGVAQVIVLSDGPARLPGLRRCRHATRLRLDAIDSLYADNPHVAHASS